MKLLDIEVLCLICVICYIIITSYQLVQMLPVKIFNYIVREPSLSQMAIQGIWELNEGGTLPGSEQVSDLPD